MENWKYLSSQIYWRILQIIIIIIPLLLHSGLAHDEKLYILWSFPLVYKCYSYHVHNAN